MIRSVVIAVLNLYTLLIFVWALFSWFDHSKGVLSDIYTALDKLVRPYVSLFKRFIPPMGGLDLSPLVALVVLQILSRLLIAIL